ncbi:hypothetical protein [Larkinella punicea]|uniref:DUF4397 domain-containing protein n=1 Tax=Larkinella punicea TaxID=2315727 RepID=A0A368JF00_9BACT|nr:hypothetical protein [Larkinella punicea]RCR66217.1 hypothetical protein DUE52_28095 [Larkinella punicea]
MKKNVLALVTLLAVVSCKDSNEVKPEDLGSYLIYTSLSASKFDQVEVKLDGKTVGLLSKPYLATTQQSVPPCGSETAGVVLNISRPVGSYSLDAVATLNGKQVTKWSSSVRFEVGSCKRTRLTSDL